MSKQVAKKVDIAVVAKTWARQIVDVDDNVEYLESSLRRYDNGKSWSISLLGDSKHFEARYMLTHLSDADRKAIDQYIVGKFKKAIRDGKKKLETLSANL